jgi:hypothetical protein
MKPIRGRINDLQRPSALADRSPARNLPCYIYGRLRRRDDSLAYRLRVLRQPLDRNVHKQRSKQRCGLVFGVLEDLFGVGLVR